ncbi:MAG: FAD-dependent oxidoreductase [Bacillota bacterium]
MKRSYDVIVGGGGLSGVAAAIAAKRKGVEDVLLIERYGFLGGMATSGLVNPFMPFWRTGTKRNKKNQLVFGIFQEILDRLSQLNGARQEGNWMFDPEIMKIVLNKMIQESGVDILLHSYIEGLTKENDNIVNIRVANKSGVYSLNGDLIIDATGDADIAYMAGVPCEKGREKDGFSQPMTMNFRLANVDKSKIPPADEINDKYEKAKAAGKINNPREDVLKFDTLRDDVVHFNTTRIIKKDATDAEDLTQAETEVREQVWEMFRFLKNEISGFENSYIQQTAPQIGVRESRRIVGTYILTKEDVVSGKKFDDSIAYCSYNIDIHNPAGTGTEFAHLEKGDYYGIPYRSLLPKYVDNLLIVGRPISSTHAAHASLRIMPTCTAIGEAAGVAVAICFDNNYLPGEVDGNKLKSLLETEEILPVFNK